MEVYNILRGINREDSESLFCGVEMSNTRRHAYEVRGGSFNGEVQGMFFYTE